MVPAARDAGKGRAGKRWASAGRVGESPTPASRVVRPRPSLVRRLRLPVPSVRLGMS